MNPNYNAGIFDGWPTEIIRQNPAVFAAVTHENRYLYFLQRAEKGPFSTPWFCQ